MAVVHITRETNFFQGITLTTSSEKTFSLIASRKGKNTGILSKSRFRMETITFLCFYRAAYLKRRPRTRFADQRTSKIVAFLRIPSKLFMSATWNGRIMHRNITAAYLQELFEPVTAAFRLNIQVNNFYTWTKDHIRSVITASCTVQKSCTRPIYPWIAKLSVEEDCCL